MERVGDLEIEQDLRYTEREWRAERLGWAVLLLLIALAIGGLFGNGPLSWATVESSDGDLEVAHERFGRRGGSQELTLRAAAAAATDGKWKVFISRDYLKALGVSTVSPQPDSVEADRGGAVFTFAQATPSADLEAVFALNPKGLWSQDGEISLSTGARVSPSQFFFP